MIKTPDHMDFRDQIQKIRIAMNLNNQNMADMLGLSMIQYDKFLQGSRDLPVTSLYRLIESTKISYEAFQAGTVDLNLLSEQANGNQKVIHPKYLIGAHSKRRVIGNILAFSETVLGPVIRERVNRHFQVRNQIWDNPDETVNFHFVRDVLLLLRKHGLSENKILEAGRHILVSAKSSKLGKDLAKLPSPTSIYECFFQEAVAELERNCLYSIVYQNKDHMIVESRSNPDVSDALHMKHIACAETCLLRIGTISALVGFIGLPPASVKKNKCVNRGDEVCQFEISLSGFRPAGTNII